MTSKKIPKGYKQITLILPNYTVEQLDKICDKENRKRPAQVKHMIERYAEIKVIVGGKGNEG